MHSTSFLAQMLMMQEEMDPEVTMSEELSGIWIAVTRKTIPMVLDGVSSMLSSAGITLEPVSSSIL